MPILTETKPAHWPARGVASTSVLQPYRVISGPVAWWHVQLGSVALLNVVLWILSVVAVLRGTTLFHAETDFTCRMQLLLSAAYVLGCAFRSVLPVYDIPRMVLIDSRLSSVVVGRSVATVAELAFAAQWAVMLHRVAVMTGSELALDVSLAIVPLIVLAEVFSWRAVLTTEQRGHILENSLWGLCAVLIVASFLSIGPHRFADMYPLIIAWCVGGAIYAGFIFLFDVPMYWTRWLADRTNGRRYMSVAQGVLDVCRRRVVSHRWEDWKSEMTWMSLYFSLGVWSSISLVYAAIALGAHGKL